MILELREVPTTHNQQASSWFIPHGQHKARPPSLVAFGLFLYDLMRKGQVYLCAPFVCLYRVLCIFQPCAKEVLLRFTKATPFQGAGHPMLGFQEFSVVFPFLLHFVCVLNTKPVSVISEGWYFGAVQYFEAFKTLPASFLPRSPYDSISHSVLNTEQFYPWKFSYTRNGMRRRTAMKSAEAAFIVKWLLSFRKSDHKGCQEFKLFKYS